MTPARNEIARILIVDDEPSIRRFASRALASVGYHVLEAADGAEALAVICTDREAIDAVVSDVVMPAMSGVELLQHLAVSHPHVPVILMSGYGSGQLQQRGIAVPCGVLAKPFTPGRLVEEVQRCLRGTDPIATPGRASG